MVVIAVAPSATIVNTAPRAALKCSRSRGTLFILPWNPCSPSRRNPIHDRVEYALAASQRNGHAFSASEALLLSAETVPLLAGADA